MQPIGEHLVARHLGDHRDLGAGTRPAVDERPSGLQVSQHAVATASLPRDVGQHQGRFGGPIAVAGCGQGFARLGELVDALQSSQIADSAVLQEQSGPFGVA